MTETTIEAVRLSDIQPGDQITMRVNGRFMWRCIVRSVCRASNLDGDRTTIVPEGRVLLDAETGRTDTFTSVRAWRHRGQVTFERSLVGVGCD